MSARGEATIQVDDREVNVLYTNRALANAEAATGKSILGIAQGFADGTSGVTELAQILRVGMEAARLEAGGRGKPASLREAFDVLDQAGFAAVAGSVMEAVAVVLGYGGEEEAEDLESDPNA